MNLKKTKEIQMTANQSAHNVLKKRLYSMKDLVTEIGATQWFWRSQIWGGLLPYVQVGRKMFVDSNDIENFIQQNKNIN